MISVCIVFKHARARILIIATDTIVDAMGTITAEIDAMVAEMECI